MRLRRIVPGVGTELYWYMSKSDAKKPDCCAVFVSVRLKDKKTGKMSYANAQIHHSDYDRLYFYFDFVDIDFRNVEEVTAIMYTKANFQRNPIYDTIGTQTLIVNYEQLGK